MKRLLSLSAAAAALALSPAMTSAAMANDAAEEVAVAEGATPVKLVEFNGGFEVLKTSSRLRIWRSHLAYKISVDAEGNPTECELTESFRRTYVKQKLCSILMKHHTFEPARDAANEPVEGSYSNRLSYLDLREKY